MNKLLKDFIEDVSGKKLKNFENKLVDNFVLVNNKKVYIHEGNVPVIGFDPASGKDSSAKISIIHNEISGFRLVGVIFDDK
jgi:hypothetical protein